MLHGIRRLLRCNCQRLRVYKKECTCHMLSYKQASTQGSGSSRQHAFNYTSGEGQCNMSVMEAENWHLIVAYLQTCLLPSTKTQLESVSQMEKFLGYLDNLRMIPCRLLKKCYMGYDDYWGAIASDSEFTKRNAPATCYHTNKHPLKVVGVRDNTPSITPQGKDNATCL